MGQCLTERDYVFFWLSFFVIVWDTWLDQKNLQNDSGKPFFLKFLMPSWTKLETAADNEKRKLQKA